MRHSNSVLGKVVVGVIGALVAFAPVSQAAEPRASTSSPASRIHRITDVTMKRGVVGKTRPAPLETVEFTFQKISFHFNPKELTIDKTVPWQQGTPRN